MIEISRRLHEAREALRHLHEANDRLTAGGRRPSDGLGYLGLSARTALNAALIEAERYTTSLINATTCDACKADVANLHTCTVAP